jgi:integrase
VRSRKRRTLPGCFGYLMASSYGGGTGGPGLGHINLTPYKLRHTAASLAIASGADVNVIQTMPGHKSATLTLDVYGHLFPDRLDEVSSAVHKRRAKVLAKTEEAERKA